MENRRRMMLFPKESSVRSSLWRQTSLHVTKVFIPNLFKYVKENVYGLLFPETEPNVSHSQPSILPAFPLSYMCKKDIQELVVFTPPSKICTKHDVATETFEPVKRKSEGKVKGPFKKAKSTQTEDRVPRQLGTTPSWKKVQIPKYALPNHSSANDISSKTSTEIFSKIYEINFPSFKSIEELRKEERKDIDIGIFGNSFGNTKNSSKRQCCCQKKKKSDEKDSCSSNDTKKQISKEKKNDTAVFATDKIDKEIGKEIEKEIGKEIDKEIGKEIVEEIGKETVEEVMISRPEAIKSEQNKENENKMSDKKQSTNSEKDIIHETIVGKEKENEKVEGIGNEILATDYTNGQTCTAKSQIVNYEDKSPCRLPSHHELAENQGFSELQPVFCPEKTEDTQRTPEFESKYTKPEEYPKYPLQETNFNPFLKENPQNPAIEMPTAGCSPKFGENTFFVANSQQKNPSSMDSNPFLNPNVANTTSTKSLFKFGGLSEPSTPSVLSTPSTFPPNSMFRHCNASPFLSSQDTEMDLSDHIFPSQAEFPSCQNSVVNTQNNLFGSSGGLFAAGNGIMFANKPTEPLIPTGGTFTMGVIPKLKK